MKLPFLSKVKKSLDNAYQQELYDDNGEVIDNTPKTDVKKTKTKKVKQMSKDKIVCDESKTATEDEGLIASSDFTPGRMYWFVVAVLLMAVIILGVMNVEQIQERHKVYRELSVARQDYRTMRTEEERLIIEQQTFSATATVAQRAVTELGMFYPSQTHRIIVPSPKL